MNSAEADTEVRKDAGRPRVAVVIGGSGGIGGAVAHRLAADGMTAVIHYAGSAAKAEAAVTSVAAAGGTAVALPGDVAEPAEMTRLFDKVESRFGGVDAVVNTAGIMLLAPLAEMDLETFDRMYRVNVRGTFVVSQLAARRLRPGGALINFSTSVTRLQQPGYGGYAASKRGPDRRDRLRRAPGTARHPRGHRGSRRLPRRTRQPLDQRPGAVQ